MQYVLQRKKRKTISISVNDDCEIVVCAPQKMEIANIERLLLQKTATIDRLIKGKQAQIQKYGELMTYKTVLFLGKKLKPTLGKTKQIEMSGDCLFLPESRFCVGPMDTKTIRAVKRWYLDCATRYLFGRLTYFDQASGEPKLINGRSRWGCCDSKHNISLNWRLILLPKNLSDYVIIHEICHKKYLNHSQAFWREVQHFCPNYRQLRKELKEYGFVMQLFRDKNK